MLASNAVSADLGHDILEVFEEGFLGSPFRDPEDEKSGDYCEEGDALGILRKGRGHGCVCEWLCSTTLVL